MRSAQSEHPDRFGLIDLDDSDGARAALATAVASREPQVAVRGDRILVPRLARARSDAAVADAGRAAGGTVLITGGTGGIGALIARHLVTAHGVEHLLLVSRSGERAPGAGELAGELQALGAAVRIAACDTGDRDQVQALLASISAEHPLTGVVHAAGVADNSLIESMTADQVDRVLAPKLDAGWHLHELTQQLDLAFFVLCSSMAATFGGPGQANYAAANAFLDALAHHRRARGLTGVSVEWGIWENVGKARALTGSPDQALRQMAGSASFRSFPADLGLHLFDRALAVTPPVVLAAPYRIDVVRDEVAAGTVAPLLSGLVRSRPQRVTANGNGASARRHRETGGNGRPENVADATRAQIAAALGYESAASLQMNLSFLELGFDSLVSLELRKRLQSVTGLSLPATIMFDHPTPAALVAHLQGLVNGAGTGPGESSSPAATTDAGSGAAAGTGADSLAAMFRRAHSLGKTKDGVALAHAAARLRSSFGLSHIDSQAPTVIPLARGDQHPIVFCIPSLVATAGPHEYARFAKRFADRRDVVAVPVPGFAADELLPSTLDAAIGALVSAIQAHAEGRPLALVGFSTGGVLAHAVAGACARAGSPPAAVVLIDSYTMDTMWRITDPVFDRMLAGDGAGPAVTDQTLSAMGAYLGMLSAWTPDEPVAPTLLVKATEVLPGVIRNGDWTATWQRCHATVELPGSHLTLLEDHIDTTTAAVEDWISRHQHMVPQRGRRRRLSRTR